MAYKIILKPSAQRDLDSLHERDVEKIFRRIVHLSTDPRPFGVQKLTNTEAYRIRSGLYRVLYEIDDKQKKVFIYRIKHRKEAYR